MTGRCSMPAARGAPTGAGGSATGSRVRSALTPFRVCLSNFRFRLDLDFNFSPTLRSLADGLKFVLLLQGDGLRWMTEAVHCARLSVSCDQFRRLALGFDTVVGLVAVEFEGRLGSAVCCYVKMSIFASSIALM